MFTPRSAARLAVGSLAALAVALPAQAGAVRAESVQLTKRAPGTAGAPGPTTFAGATTQFPCRLHTDNIFCGNVNVFMTKSMKRVKRVLLGFEATCQAPDMFFGMNLIMKGLPARKGRTGSSFSVQQPVDLPLPDNMSARAQVALSGKAKQGSTGKGSFSITIAVFDSFGGHVDTCTTGRQSYKLEALKRR